MYEDAAIVLPCKIMTVVYYCLQECVSRRNVLWDPEIQQLIPYFSKLALSLTAGKCRKNSGFSNYRPRKSCVSIQGAHNTRVRTQSTRHICVTVAVAQEPALRKGICQSFLLLIQPHASTALCQSTSPSTACKVNSGFFFFLFLKKKKENPVSI